MCKCLYVLRTHTNTFAPLFSKQSAHDMCVCMRAVANIHFFVPISFKRQTHAYNDFWVLVHTRYAHALLRHVFSFFRFVSCTFWQFVVGSVSFFPCVFGKCVCMCVCVFVQCIWRAADTYQLTLSINQFMNVCVSFTIFEQTCHRQMDILLCDMMAFPSMNCRLSAPMLYTCVPLKLRV